MFDKALLITIIFIIVSTIIGTFLNSRRRDRWLVPFLFGTELGLREEV